MNQKNFKLNSNQEVSLTSLTENGHQPRHEKPCNLYGYLKTLPGDLWIIETTSASIYDADNTA